MVRPSSVLPPPPSSRLPQGDERNETEVSSSTQHHCAEEEVSSHWIDQKRADGVAKKKKKRQPVQVHVLVAPSGAECKLLMLPPAGCFSLQMSLPCEWLPAICDNIAPPQCVELGTCECSRLAASK